MIIIPDLETGKYGIKQKGVCQQAFGFLFGKTLLLGEIIIGNLPVILPFQNIMRFWNLVQKASLFGS